MRVNISYGKFANGVFAYAPYRLDVGEKQIYNGTAENYLQAGYLPVIHAERPADGNFVAVFIETDGVITKEWAERKGDE